MPDSAPEFLETAEFSSLDADQKLDTIFHALRVLNDQVHGLKTYLTAPAKQPSAVDTLTKTIEQLVVETGAQTKMLSGIGNSLEQILGEPPEETGAPNTAVPRN
jgi:hypothetical protein